MKFSLYLNDLKNNSNILSSSQLENSEELGRLKVCTDSRQIQEDEWFLPIVGETFDGHSFIEKINCQGVIFDGAKISKEVVAEKQKNWIEVKDTTKFFQEAGNIAVTNFKKRGGLVIGLTGSNGKTTNKEYLSYILQTLFPKKVYSTHGNFNNHLGVPFCCLSIEDSHEIAVIEMGTNHFGEIKTLVNISNPDAGFITNIGDAHLEFLIDRDGVLKEKRAIYDYIVKHSDKPFRFLINGDDPKLEELDNLHPGIETSKNKINIKDGVISVNFDKQVYKIENKNIFGKINFHNLGFVSLFLAHIFPEKSDEIFEAANKVEAPQNNRSSWITWKNKNVFLDAYNANPSSMQASLESFNEHVEQNPKECGKVLFILGDMKEIGSSARQKHMEISESLSSFLEKYENASVIFVGEHAQDYIDGLGRSESKATGYHSVSNVALSQLENAQTIFVKGSRSIRLETLFS